MTSIGETATRFAAMATLLYENEEFLSAWSYDSQENGKPYGDVSFIQVYGTSYGDLDFTCIGPQTRLLMRKLCKQLGGKWNKDAYGQTFVMKRKTENGIHLQVHANREQVCTPRVVGTKEVERFDPNAPKITVTEEVIEYDCPESLLALTREGE